MLSGFKNFILRGNLVDLAVAVIVGTSFAAVVAAFTAWLTQAIVGDNSDFFSGGLGTFGFFLNAELVRGLGADHVIDYQTEDFTRDGKRYDVIMDTHGNAPYTRVKERYFPSAPPGTPEDIQLLQEIRDLIAAQSGTTPPSVPPSA